MSYSVTPLRLAEHRDALARLWAENMSDARIASVIPDRMRWLYEQGPDGPTTTVVCTHAESGEVIGCGSFFHRPTWVDGRRVRAGVLCDFAVARAHRVAGAAIAIQRALVHAGHEEGLELLYGYPNAHSLPVLKRIGYSIVGETTTWVKPLRSEYKLRGTRLGERFAPLAALPIDLGLRALDGLRGMRAGRGFRSELVQASDPRGEALWERARARYGVVGEKSSAYLEWRYGRFTTAEHRFFGLCSEDGARLAGYGVYTLEEGKAFLGDLFAEDLDATAEALLLAVAEHLRRQQVDTISLSYVGSAAFGDLLRRLGFVLRPGKRSLALYPKGVAEPLRGRVSDPASWFMLDGELDI